MHKRTLVLAVMMMGLFVSMASADDEKKKDKKKDKSEKGFVSMFDGKTLKGWKNNENPKSFKVENGAIVSNGPRSHLFYVKEEKKPFVNFEFKADVMTMPNSNAGIYFHTKYQPKGWPKYGFEAQVNNSYKKDWRRTAGLYGVMDVKKAPAKDNEWFTMHIIVKDRLVVIKVNDKVITRYEEPKGKKPGKNFTRKLDKGTFAIQAHDPGSKVLFKNLRIKRLPTKKVEKKK